MTQTSRALKHKPLVEAILEVRWRLVTRSPGNAYDPHYKLLLARLFDRLQSAYPEHEQLPTAGIPDEMADYVVQHRFRAGTNDWPVVQIGPGILTVNDTSKYIWPDYRSYCLGVIAKLYDAHPKPSELTITSLTLRYIDAIELDSQSEDVFGFLRDKMRVEVGLPQNLFESGTIKKSPAHFNWNSMFRSEQPAGMLQLRFATGEKNSTPALLWETSVQSIDADVPTMPTGFETWLDGAHRLTGDWFFKLIEGDLRRRFQGE